MLYGERNMKIAMVINTTDTYKTREIEELCKCNKDETINVYYILDNDEGVPLKNKETNLFEETYLKKGRFFGRFLNNHRGLINIVRSNDVIFIGGYEESSYIILGILCKLLKKPYVIIVDGIIRSREGEKESTFSLFLKNFIVSEASYIWASGKMVYKDLIEFFQYTSKKIFLKYLTVDGEKIMNLYPERENIREEIRKKYGISNEAKVINYAGNLTTSNNVKVIIKAIATLKRDDIVLLITGDGAEKLSLLYMAKKKNVKIIITGFIEKKEDLFKNYYASDLFVLPSMYEPWGLVVNEAMYARLPIIVSEHCGCALDLVEGNGYVFNPRNSTDLASKIDKIFYSDSSKDRGEVSYNKILNWSFEKSAKSFKDLISNIRKLQEENS